MYHTFDTSACIASEVSHLPKIPASAMDSLKTWPEPVVRVQSLAESGMKAIPKQYVKPAWERPSLNSCKEVNHVNLPIIDMAGLDGPERAETMRLISDACREWGFYQVVNHGVAPQLLRKTREVWRQFFHLPLELKQVYANSPETYEGYGSRVGVQNGVILDWGDYYFLNLLPTSVKDVSKWPAMPLSCREIVEEYGKESIKLCGTIMKILSVSLGLDEGHLYRAFGGEEIGACLRVNYYPKCPQPDLTLGLSPHSDPGGFTLLLPDNQVTGLQVWHGNSWVTVQPAPDSFIVNMGDQIQVLSNANYKSVEHRVVVNSEVERLSLALFYSPKGELPVGPIPELVGPGQLPLYQPMTFDQYRIYIRKWGPSGKAQVESLRPMRHE